VKNVASHPRFGPAGTPYVFGLLKQPVTELPSFLRAEGLDAFEYQASRWGPKPQMKRENAEKLGLNARQNDVWLSMHGSYFINLTGDEEVSQASKKRLLACATAARWMNAHSVVFHPGFYGKHASQEVLDRLIKALNEIVEEMKNSGIRANLAPEVTGKTSQLGNLEEVLTICEKIEQTEPIIDWAHIHARTQGSLRTYDDFAKIIDKIEKRLGTNVVENLHCHFSKIEFSKKGELRHHVLEETEYGPEFRILARVIVELGLKPIIICESPLLDIDARKMRNILHRVAGKREKGKV
jgi:deoxyribonuclease-4